jgi:signal transduction histidine kinase/CheY-like chemotaxis protein/HPt (histidine-containing phosphotransfer) domain-containing protein
MGIAVAAATLIERDAGSYRRFIETLDTDSKYYRMLKADMEKIRFGNRDNIAFLYAEIRVSDTEMMYIVDGEIAGTDTYAEPGLRESLTETRRIAYDTRAPYIGDFVTTVWGTLLSAYVPIFDPDTGDFIGIIGADVSIEQYNEIMNKQLFTIVASIGALILMMLVMSSRLLFVHGQKLRSDESNTSKSKFLAHMSHEIRTPMNAIIGLSEVALREHGSPKALECIMGIKSAGADLISIINDILDFSRIESGNLSILSAPYETDSFLNDVLTVIRVRMAETPLELILDVSPGIPARLVGDAGRVKQILLNLLSNAVKYTKEGFVRFSASGEPLSENTIRLSFVVEDSGIGIRPENLEKLFSEFMRIDEKRNSGIEGTGLGLSIARSLCRIMGGDISARSEYGKGSAFIATLTQTVTDWKPIGEMADITVTRVKPQRITFTAMEAEVLVADDFPSNLLVAEGLLAPYGIRVFTCANGREAVAQVRERAFDLVLMDHMMPEMDGVEATLAIRNMDEEYGRTIPIVALTANAVAGMEKVFLENGFDDFLAKPIETIKLDAVLRKWIPADKQRDAPENDEKAQAPEETVLPEIVGVNVAAGLARIGGSPRRYLELLEMFRRDAAAAFPSLEKEPDDASLRSFTTQVHALKSALANIGANDLSHAAALLEKAGREAKLSMIRDTLPPFREELSTLMARIAEFSAFHSTNSTNEEEGTSPAMRETLARLREALEARDFDAIDAALAQAQSLPAAGKTRSAASEVADLILMSDFQKAVATINGLLGQSQPDR